MKEKVFLAYTENCPLETVGFSVQIFLESSNN